MKPRLLAGALVALTLCTLAGCGQATAAHGGASASVPTATLAPTSTPQPSPAPPANVPAGWHVYFGTTFSIAYPDGWYVTLGPAQTGLRGGSATFSGSDLGHGSVSVITSYGYSQSQIQAMCQLPGTHTTLDGLPMNYGVVGYVHRNWQFLNADGISFVLDAFDLNQPQSQQAMDDAVLATFRPANPAPGCSW